MLGGAFGPAGDDKADVEALGRGFDAGANPAALVPGFGLIAGLGKAAQAELLIERPAGADVISGVIDRPVERGPKDIVDSVVVAPRHDLGTAVMTVTPDGDACRRPVPADASDQAAQVAADLLARGRLAGTQDDRDRAAGCGVVDVDRQETAFIVMRIE